MGWCSTCADVVVRHAVMHVIDLLSLGFLMYRLPSRTGHRAALQSASPQPRFIGQVEECILREEYLPICTVTLRMGF